MFLEIDITYNVASEWNQKLNNLESNLDFALTPEAPQ